METVTIAGQRFRQLRLDGKDVGPTLARMPLKRAYLRREGGCVMQGVAPAHVPEDVATLTRPGEFYVLLVEENGTGAGE